MSWSFNAIGKPAAVAKKARADLEKILCAEPEQSVKAGVISMIEAACGGMPEDSAIRIEASGSQSPAYRISGGSYHEIKGSVMNSLTLKIEPIHGFVE